MTKLILCVFFVLFTAQVGGSAMADKKTLQCVGRCEIELGVKTCQEAIASYDFNGDCCSLHTPSQGNCTLVSTTSCYFVAKGNDGCTTDSAGMTTCSQEVPGTTIKAGALYHGLNDTGSDCPASEVDIPEPTAVVELGPSTEPITIGGDLGVGFDFAHPTATQPGSGVPPSANNDPSRPSMDKKEPAGTVPLEDEVFGAPLPTSAAGRTTPLALTMIASGCALLFWLVHIAT